jgi:hypothetical protein
MGANIMQLVPAQRIRPMSIEAGAPYYTVKARDVHTLTAKNQVIQVLSGNAWISNNGEDFILGAGDTITLFPGGDRTAAISPLRGTTVTYTLR